MHLTPTLTLLAAALGLASATSLNCNPPGQARLTEARLANIIDNLRGSNRYVQADTNGPCVLIECNGGTGTWLCSEGVNYVSTPELGNLFDTKYRDCHGHTPQSTAGDSSFAPALEWHDNGFRIFAHGSAC